MLHGHDNIKINTTREHVINS